MSKVNLEKPISQLKFWITKEDFLYLAARLELEPLALAWMIGYKNLQFCGKYLRGLRAACLFYFVASQGQDLRALLTEAEDAITMKEAVAITRYNHKATLLNLRILGIEPLTKDPLYIPRSALAVMMSPSLKHIKELFEQNPLRLWRHSQKMRIMDAAHKLGIEPRRLLRLESGSGARPTVGEDLRLDTVIKWGISLELFEWYERLRAARYEAAPSSRG